MFLKTLYISGFKSFAYPTKIDFTEDISAIIGPNGSGKSNISDAIRFVLGEQRTKSLRSHNMQDIIFSGTDSDRPRGVAHVQLVLSQDNKSDLVIERKYYRTGDSEYKINGKRVRLKDIQALFWDTGLSKNGYSIISQGGVESIVGANPNELRYLVEEAVGIAGYKVQQSETLKRLEIIEANIDRVSDILNEIEKQLKPLKKHADTTRQYLKIYNILKDIDLVDFFEKEKTFNSELERLNSVLINSNFSLVDLDKLAEEKDKKYLNIKHQRKEIENKLSKTKDEIDNLKQNEKKLTLEKNSISEEISNISHKVNEFQIRNEEINHNLNKNNKNLSHFNNLIKNKKKDLQLFQNIVKKDEKQLSNFKSKLTEIKRNKSVNDLSKLQKEYDLLIEEKIKIDLELKQEISLEKENEKKYSELNSQKKDLLKQNLNNNTNRKELNKKIKNIENAITENENDLKKETTKLNNLETELQIIKNNLKFEENFKNSNAGFRESVKSVLNYVKEQSITGVYGTISDLFETKEKYQVAIQVALGNSIQNIVVENSDIAKNLINYLKRTKKGRATFIPLDLKSSSNKIRNNYIKDNNSIGFANTLIKTDPKFKKIFDQLLGRTLVFQNYSEAQKFRRRNPYFTLITLEGECFYSNGAIVGGSINKKTLQLTNNRNRIKNIKNQKQETKKLITDLETIIESKSKTINNLKNNLLIFNNEISELEKKSFQIKTQKNLINETINDLKQNVPQIENYKKDLKLVEEKINSLNKIISETKKESSSLTKSKENLNEEIFKLQEILTNDKIRENKVYQEYLNIENQIKNLENDITLSQEKIISNNKEINQLEFTLNTKKESLNRIKKNNEEIQNRLFKLNHDLQELELESNKLYEDWIHIEEEIKCINKDRIIEVESKSKIERQIDQIKFKQNNLSESIYEKYNLNYSMVKSEIESIKKRKKDLTTSEINKLKSQLKEIGSVNLSAIEDYNKLKERYDNLKLSYNDLINSKQDIENTINNLNLTMSNQFRKKFIELNSLFSKVFSILFEGGNARLEFLNSDDILNSGIQLFAQPPGKNLKNINLLSGGEKAMTAIALLLTFIQLNPTPFVIIDEIDAALDDNNINRFSRYIQKIREGNQFIIITHRKGTIQICNNIHGISMNKNGISRCCSFEISDYLD